MARAWLADDRPSRSHHASPSTGGWGVALDPDPGGGEYVWNRTETPDGTPDGGALQYLLWALRQVTITVRELGDYDEHDNPVWKWTEAYSGPVVVGSETRVEVDDPGQSTLVEATITVPWLRDRPPIDESSMVKDLEGGVWRVVRAVREGDRYALTVQMATTQTAPLS